MKKRIVRSLALFLCVLFAAASAPFVRAEADCEFTLSSVTVPERARTVTLKLSAKTAVPVAEARFVIKLPEGCAVSSISPKGGASKPVLEKTGDGNISFVFENADQPLSGSAELASITVSLPETKHTGETFRLEIDVKDNDVLDQNKSSVDTLLTGGLITVEGEVMYGDANGDCAVNSRDVMLIMKHIVGAPISRYFDIKAADVNIDEKLNSRDVTNLMKALIDVPTVRLGHHDVIEILEKATCKKNGLARLTCTECGDSVTVPTPLGDHVYEHGVCKVCGKKHADYPVIAYSEYLKKNGTFENALRGHAIYKSVTLSQYKLFESNICDSKDGSLVLYGVATFDNGLSCYVSIELLHVGGPYTLHYDAEYKGKIIGSASGTIDSALNIVFGEKTGIDSDKEASHVKIAMSVAYNLLAYTSELLEASGTGITLADLKLKSD